MGTSNAKLIKHCFPAEFSYFAWATSTTWCVPCICCISDNGGKGNPTLRPAGGCCWRCWTVGAKSSKQEENKKNEHQDDLMIFFWIISIRFFCVQTFGTLVVNSLWLAQIPDLLNCEPFINGSQVPKMKVYIHYIVTTLHHIAPHCWNCPLHKLYTYSLIAKKEYLRVLLLFNMGLDRLCLYQSFLVQQTCYGILLWFTIDFTTWSLKKIGKPMVIFGLPPSKTAPKPACFLVQALILQLQEPWIQRITWWSKDDRHGTSMAQTSRRNFHRPHIYY